MDIDGMGTEIITRLVERDLLHDVSDFYVLDEDDLAALDMGRVKKDGSPVVLGPVVAAKLVARSTRRAPVRCPRDLRAGESATWARPSPSCSPRSSARSTR
jgi:hypothetical protein